MKILFYIISLIIMTLLSGYMMPQWWMIIFIAFLLAIIFKFSVINSGWVTFLTVSITWLLVAWNIDSANEGVLSERIGSLFTVGSTGILIISTLIGGITSSFGAMTGASLGKLINK